MAGITPAALDELHPNRIRGVGEVNIEIGHEEFLVLMVPWGGGESPVPRTIAELEENTQGGMPTRGQVVSVPRPEHRAMVTVIPIYAPPDIPTL